MKNYSYIIVLSILLLTACQVKQPNSESQISSQESSQEPSQESSQESSQEPNQESTDEPMTKESMSTVTVPLIPESDILYEGYPELTDYDSVAASAVAPIEEQEGTYGGSPVIWSTINDGNFLHFYYAVTYPEKWGPELATHAIIGENIKLSCGIRVGMTADEAEAIIPGLYHFKWGNPGIMSIMDWNSGSYPNGWCEQFPQILIAEVDNGQEMPMTIGLFLDEEDIIRAIVFNYPTAG